MTTIESNKIQLNNSEGEVFEFLNDINNHKSLMPLSVSEWWSNYDEVKLKIQGLGTIHLKKAETKLNSYLKIVPASKAPVDLFIEWFITPENNICNVKAVISADLNMFMKMLAEKPLQNIVEHMANSLKNHFS